MLARLSVGLLLLFAALLLLWSDKPWLWNMVTFMAVLPAAWEWGLLGGLSTIAAAWYTGFFALLLVLGGVALEGNLMATDTVLIAVCCWWALIAPWSLRRQWRWRRVWFLALGMLLLFTAWYATVLLFANNVYALLAAFSVVWVSDSVAYFTGKTWGQNRIAPQLSPGKTWEGVLGGMSAVLLLAYVVAPLFFSVPSPMWLVAAAATMVGLGVLGDLFESSIKRRAGAKDSGVLLGSHGGVLDRVDALLPTLPFAALIAGIV